MIWELLSEDFASVLLYVYSNGCRVVILTFSVLCMSSFYVFENELHDPLMLTLGATAKSSTVQGKNGKI